MEHILISVLIIGASTLLAAAFVTGYLMTRTKASGEDAAYLLVLGSTVNGTNPSIMLRERILAAYDYLCSHPNTICIPTGGKNPDADIPEAQCIANELMALGIYESRIWIEPKAESTRENLRFSLDLIEAKTGSRPQKIGFLTSDFHVLRVLLTAKRMGICVSANASRSAHTIFYYPAFLREILALWYYLLFA